MIRDRMLRRNANLISLSGFLIPGHGVPDVFTRVTEEDAKKRPPFSPSVALRLHKARWVAPLQSHERAAKLWGDIVSRKGPKDGAHQVRLRA